jgi:hypothetical protein
VKSGVMDSLTKVLMKTYQEHPENPVEFIKEHISNSLRQKMKIQEWQEKIQKLDDEIAQVEAELEEAKGKLLEKEMSESKKE